MLGAYAVPNHPDAVHNGAHVNAYRDERALSLAELPLAGVLGSAETVRAEEIELTVRRAAIASAAAIRTARVIASPAPLQRLVPLLGGLMNAGGFARSPHGHERSRAVSVRMGDD